LIGSWFGTGTDRGLALLFTAAGLVGLVVTFIAMRSSAYRLLSNNYAQQQNQEMSSTYSAASTEST
jgi:DHA3 family multidrug efflux protein-like MFS transporter